MKVLRRFIVHNPASSPTISIHPATSAPVALALIPVKAPAAKATLFHCFILIYPLAGIAEPAVVGATFKAEYTPIKIPDAPPPSEIVVPAAGTVLAPVSKGIRRTRVLSIVQVPPNVAESVILPSDADVF